MIPMNTDQSYTSHWDHSSVFGTIIPNVMKLHPHKEANINACVDLGMRLPMRKQLLPASKEGCLTSGTNVSRVTNIWDVSGVDGSFYIEYWYCFSIILLFNTFSILLLSTKLFQLYRG